MIQEKQYYAFISYKREDEKWAKWLQNKLEHYRFPTNLNGRTDLPKNIRPTFRDVTDLNPGLLAEEISNALSNSEWLIVICSPRSAKSPWVCKEAQTFIELGRADHIIPFVIEGHPFSSDITTECYPEALLNLTGSQELLAANIHEIGCDAAMVKVVSRMFGLRFDILWQRYERQKNQKRITTLVLFLVTICIIISTFMYVNYQKQIADNAQRERLIQKLYSDYFQCEKLYNDKKYVLSFNKCQDILRKDDIIPDTLASRFEYILRMSYAALQSDTLTVSNKFVAEFPAMDWGEMPVVFSDNGDLVYVGCSGLTILNANTGKRIVHSATWPEKIRVVGDQLYTFDDFEVSVFDINSLEKLTSYKLSTNSEYHQMMVGSSADGKRFLTENYKDGSYNVYETTSGRLVNSFSSATMASINYNGTIIAISRNDKLSLYQVDSGAKIEEYANLYATNLQFDESGKWLLLYLENCDALNILNIETKENYYIENVHNQWGNSFNFDGNLYGNKYIVSDDGRYIAVGANIYDMADGSLFKTLENSEGAMGLKIFPDAKKVLQVNVNREILVYSRNGEAMFKTINTDFSNIIDNDKTNDKYNITVDHGTITVTTLNGALLGVIHEVDGDVYHLSISPDEEYLLVSSLAIPSSIYRLSTGTVVQQFPFYPGDGDIGFGCMMEDGHLYFNGLNTTYMYQFFPMDELLNIKIGE